MKTFEVKKEKEIKNEQFFVEVEKAIDWEEGYLNWKGEVTTDIKEAQLFDDKEGAQDAATLFNIEYGRGGAVYARVR